MRLADCVARHSVERGRGNDLYRRPECLLGCFRNDCRFAGCVETVFGSGVIRVEINDHVNIVPGYVASCNLVVGVCVNKIN